MNIQLAQRIFDAINQHTLPGEGITRPSYSLQETLAMDEVAKYARAYGLTTSYDNVGNLHCVLEGTFAIEGEVVTGSHLDSVPHGGRYDGVAGVVAGLLVLKRLAESSKTRQKARLIVFRGEESAWFGRCYLGSLGLFGLLTKEDMERTSLHSGDSLRQIIRRSWGTGAFHEGNDVHGIPAPSVHATKNFSRFIEVHIEQGPALHEAGERIGIVDSIRGNYRYLGAQIGGEAGHSGTTPNRLRKDAVLAFADLMQRLEQGAKVFGEDLVMTCGIAGTDPARHALTTIPDAFTFDLEFRSGSDSTLKLFDAFWRATAAAVQAQRGLPSLKLGKHTTTAPAIMDPVIRRNLLRAASETLDVEDPIHLPSGAGHDAAVFAAMGIPTGMIFIRNEHGSHNPEESMRMDDLMLAAGVLYRAMGGE
jgi:beta-ureidopropionase / N-carbamoyl-L-amino-acid hydrolase